jgi:ATP-binding cassette subfamily C protein CydC
VTAPPRPDDGPPATGLWLAVAAGVAASASSIALLATSAWLISRASQHPPVLELTAAVVAVRAFAVSRSVFRYAERLAGHNAALRQLGEVRTRLYRRLERLIPAGLPLAKNPARDTGDLLHRLVSDVDARVDVLVRVALPAATATLAGLAAALAMGLVSPGAGIVLAAAVAVVAVVVPALQRTLAGRSARRLAPAHAELTARTVDLLHGWADLVAFGQAEARLADVAAIDRRLSHDTGRSARTEGLASALVTLVGGVAVWLILWLATPAVRTGDLNGVLLAVVVLTPLAVADVLSVLPAAARQAEASRPALRRLEDVVRTPDPVPDPDRPQRIAGHHLRLDGVTARWATGEPDAVDALDLDLPPGRRMALVGRSGAGKSTVAALLVRFLDPVRGKVTLGGIDLRDLDGDDVRRVVTLLDSDAHLFDTSIEENLRVAAPGATVDDLRAALAMARLDGWVEGLPEGLATRVGEGGARLSGGQRRRLALARALLTRAPVLVLDEPTEHLDEATARAITDDLLAAAGERTVVLITHRPYGLSDVDESRHARLKGDVALRGDAPHPQPAEHLPRHAVALPVPGGLLRRHVPLGDPRRPLDQIRRVVRLTTHGGELAGAGAGGEELERLGPGHACHGPSLPDGCDTLARWAAHAYPARSDGSPRR